MSSRNQIKGQEGAHSYRSRNVLLVVAMALMVAGLFAQTTVSSAQSTASTANPTPIPGSVYTALASPQRLQTETPLNSSTSVAGANHSINVTVAGGSAGAPANATAVVLVVTQTSNVATPGNPGGGNYVQVFPAGGSTTASAVNAYYPNQLVSNLVTVPVGTGGQVTLHSLVDCHVLVDEEGYYSPVSGGSTAGTYNPISPTRLVNGQSIAGGTPTKIQVTGSGGIPAGATAATVNLTVTNDNVGGYLSTSPNAQTSAPSTSNLNYNGGGQIVATRDIVSLASDGSFSLWSNAPVTVFVDANGWYGSGTSPAGSYYYAGSGVSRAHDTRISGDTIPAGSTLKVAIAGSPASGVPANATGAVLNVTIDKQTNPATRPGIGFLEVYPGTPPATQTSDLNFPANSIVANADYATLAPAPDGSITILNDSVSPVDVIVDAFGYFLTQASQSAPNAISASANPTSIPADGHSTSTITATVVNGPAPGTPVSGDVVTFTVTGTGCTQSQLASNTATTNASGQATDVFTANSTPGTCTVTATDSTNSTGAGATVTQTQPTNQTYSITPNTNQSKTVSTAAAPTQGQVTYTLTGVTSANTPTGQINIALFPSDGPNAPTSTGGTWTFNSSGGAGHAGVAQGQATSDNQTTTSPSSPNQGACGTSCFAYISNVNGTNTTNAPDQVSGVNAPSGGTVTFTVNSFQLDDAIPVVFSTPTSGQTVLQLQANGQPASGYPFAVGGDTNWGANAPAAPAGSYATEYVLSVNMANKTFVGCNNLPSGPGTTCYTFTMGSGDTYNYPAQNGGWNSSNGIINIPQAAFAADLSGPLTGQLVPSNGACGGGWAIVNGPGAGAAGLCPAGTAASNSNTKANPDVVDIAYNPGSTSIFSYADYISILASGSTSDNDVDVPAAPTGLTATGSAAGSGASVALSWTAVPNQNVSQDTQTGTAAGVRAEYDIYRATVTGGVVGAYAYIGHSTITSGSPPATTFTDTTAAGTTSYSYVVVAVSSNENGNNHQAAGPASAAAAVTTPAALPAAPKPQVSTAPISISSVVTPSPGPAPPANASGHLLIGDSFQVQFNQNIAVASNASFQLTDVDGTQGTVTCGTGGQATCSTSGNALNVTLTANPIITSIGDNSGPTDQQLDYSGSNDTGSGWIQFTSVTGVTAAGSGGLPWNLVWSGCEVSGNPGEGTDDCAPDGGSTGNPSTTTRILTMDGQDNSNMPEGVDSAPSGVFAGSTSIKFSDYFSEGSNNNPCVEAGATIAVFDNNGAPLGSGTVPGTSGSCTPSGPTTITVPALKVGQTIQFVTTNPAPSATVANAASETDQAYVPWVFSTPTSSQFFAGFANSPPQAAFTISTVPNSLGSSQTVPVTVSSNLPNSTVWLSFTPSGSSTCGTPSSALVGTTPLTATPQLFQTDGSGNLTITYTTASCAQTETGSFTDVFSAQNASAGPSIQSVAFYSYGAQPPAPTVTSVNPTAGPAAGGNIINVFGTNFVSSPAMTVYFCTASAAAVANNPGNCAGGASAPATYISPTQLQVTVPGDPGTAPNTVGVQVCDNNFGTAPNNCSATFGPGPNAGYTYGSPNVTSIAAASNNGGPTPTACTNQCGPSDGGFGQGAAYSAAGQITINGTGFDNATAVSVGGTTVTTTCAATPTPGCFTIMSDSVIKLDPPAGTGTAQAILVKNANGQGTGSSNNYDYYGLALHSMTFANHGASGTLDSPDTITLQYNEAISPASLGCSATGVTPGTSVSGISLQCLMGTGTTAATEGTMGYFATNAPPNATVSLALSSNGATVTLTVNSAATNTWGPTSATPSGNFTPNTTDTNVAGVDDKNQTEYNEDATAVTPGGSD